jgi:hypothetical protein
MQDVPPPSCCTTNACSTMVVGTSDAKWSSKTTHTHNPKQAQIAMVHLTQNDAPHKKTHTHNTKKQKEAKH